MNSFILVKGSMKSMARESVSGRRYMKVYGWMSMDLVKLTTSILSPLTANPAAANMTSLLITCKCAKRC